MAGKPSPVTPEVVRWAVEEDGRTMADLANALSIDLDTLEAWLHGDTRPSTGQVSSLAKVLARPRALFFLPRAPTQASLPADFRHPPGAESDISSATRRRVRSARRLQHALSWALREEDPVAVPRFTTDTPERRAAADVREWLRVPIEEQARFSDDRAALARWRQQLDDRGVFVFALELGRGDVRGFSMWDDHAPAIVANVSSVTPAARSFTLMHELGHLVLRADSACVEPGDALLPAGATAERWCERFAAEVLMPAADVRATVTAAARDDDIALVKRLMSRYRVSARASALRLVELGLAERSLWATVQQVFRPAPPPENAKPRSAPRHEARVRQYGDRAISAVLEHLPPGDALDLLRMTVPDVRQLPERIHGIERF